MGAFEGLGVGDAVGDVVGAFEGLRALGAPVGCKEKYEVRERQSRFFA